MFLQKHCGLPSKDELDLIYQSQKDAILASCEEKWHWSSSESSKYYALMKNFGSGNWLGDVKDYIKGSVRAVRAF